MNAFLFLHLFFFFLATGWSQTPGNSRKINTETTSSTYTKPGLNGSSEIPPLDSLLSALPARNFGPTAGGSSGTGRITAFSVYEKNPRIIYVASASGGVFKTCNSGHSFVPVFDKQYSSSIGAVTVSQRDPNLVWVGTGEGWRTSAVGWGDGIYKSKDGGKTWKNMGLPNSYRISRIVINPKNNNIVLVAVLGCLWTPNKDRGVYRTVNGGRIWKKVLYSNDSSGAADLVMDPKNPGNLLAATWEHYKKPYTFQSGGTGSGIYRSMDGGVSWHKVMKGLPTTSLGRIGFSYYRKNPRIVVAGVEYRDPEDAKYKAEGEVMSYKSGGTKCFRSVDGGESWTKLALFVTSEAGKQQPIGQGTISLYFCPPRHDPIDSNRIYFPSYEGAWVSEDAGRTFKHHLINIGGGDPHELWIDPSDNNHILSANDHCISESADRGQNAYFLNLPTIFQCYGIGYDMRKPYWVYASGQDNNGWGAPTQHVRGYISQDDYYINPSGGADDGYQPVDPEDWTTVYYDGLLGDLTRINVETMERKFVGPFVFKANSDENPFILDRDGNQTKLRADWTAPVIISHWNHRALYFGGNIVYKSENRGDSWKQISPDLTKNYPNWLKGFGNDNGGISYRNSGSDVAGTILTISESPLKQGMLWVGTDDGNLHLTRDDGVHWSNLFTNITGVPQDIRVSNISASRFEEGRAYATFDGHFLNDFHTYVYVTENFGKTWSCINSNLPVKETCYIIREGIKNPDLLFLGTESSLWVSLNRGKSWSRYQNWVLDQYTKGYFPTVKILSMEIQPRELELIVGTHGRGVYIIPIAALESLTPENLEKEVYLIPPGTIYFLGNNNKMTEPSDYSKTMFSTQPGALFCYYLKRRATGRARLSIRDSTGVKEITSIDGPVNKGLNSVQWMMPSHLNEANYRIVLTIDGKEYSQAIKVEDVSQSIITKYFK